MAQAGDQVVVDPALIAQLGGGSEPGLGVILVPVVHPRPKGHIRPDLSGAVVAALLLQLLQFLHALSLGLGQHIFRLWVCRLIVAYYHPASQRPSFRRRTVPSPFFLLPAICSPHHDTFHKAAHDFAGPLLHIARHMSVGVQRKGRLGMPQDARECFGIHAAGQSVGSEGMPKSWNLILGNPAFFNIPSYGRRPHWDGWAAPGGAGLGRSTPCRSFSCAPIEAGPCWAAG